MRYLQFFTLSTGYVEGSNPPKFIPANRKPIEACGSNGVYILGRGETSTVVGPKIAAKRGFIGWQLRVGASFTQSAAVGGVHLIQETPNVYVAP